MTEDKAPNYDDVIEVSNPFDGEVVGKVINANKIQVHEQLNKAFMFKCDLSASKREDILLKTALFLENNKESLASLISSESGLSLQDTKYEESNVCCGASCHCLRGERGSVEIRASL